MRSLEILDYLFIVTGDLAVKLDGVAIYLQCLSSYLGTCNLILLLSLSAPSLCL